MNEMILKSLIINSNLKVTHKSFIKSVVYKLVFEISLKLGDTLNKING